MCSAVVALLFCVPVGALRLGGNRDGRYSARDRGLPPGGPADLGGWPSCCARPPCFLASSSDRELYQAPMIRYWTVSRRSCRSPSRGETNREHRRREPQDGMGPRLSSQPGSSVRRDHQRLRHVSAQPGGRGGGVRKPPNGGRAVAVRCALSNRRTSASRRRGARVIDLVLFPGCRRRAWLLRRHSPPL